MVLTIFVNFTALPGIAAVFGFEIPQTNVTISEEENHGSPLVIYEKSLPPVLNVLNYLNFLELAQEDHVAALFKEADHTDPLISIFAPPPEV